MDAIKPPHHIAIHHVHHRLGHGLVHALLRAHAFLDDHRMHLLAIFDHRHFVAALAPQVFQLFGIVDGGDTHAVSAVVGLDDHKGLFIDAVFLVLAPHLGQQCIHLGAQAVHALTLGKIDLTTVGEQGVDQPRVNAQQLAKALGNFFVVFEMHALASHCPARMQRWQEVLLVQVFQNAWNPCREVVVQQNSAGIKVLEPQAALAADGRLDGDFIPTRYGNALGFLQLRADRANAHVQTCHGENTHQLRQIGPIKRIARVVLGNDEKVARLGADFFNRSHSCLHGQWQHLRRQVVPSPGEQIGIYRRQFEPGIADIHRRVKRRRVFHPLQAKPTLNGRHRVQDALLQFVDRTRQCSNEMRNHGSVQK